MCPMSTASSRGMHYFGHATALILPAEFAKPCMVFSTPSALSSPRVLQSSEGMCACSDACSPPCRSPHGCCKSARDAQFQGSLHSTALPCLSFPIPSHLAEGEDGGDGTQGELQRHQCSHAGAHQCQHACQHHHVQRLQHPPLRPDRLLLRLPLWVTGDSGGDTLSQTGCPLPPPPPQNGVTASETSPVLCSRERRVQPLPCTPTGAESCPSAQWIPKAAPQNKSPRGEAGLALTSGTGCRDKLSGGCRAPRRRRHPPTLWGKGSSGSPVSPRLSPSCPHATPKGSHLAGVHPAVPSPMPARAMPAARTPEKTFLVERSHGIARTQLQSPRGGG